MIRSFSQDSIISDRQRVIELIAVVCTGLGKFIFMDILDWKLPFILIAIVGWFVYVLQQRSKTKGILTYWGFRTDNFKRTLMIVLPFGIIAILLFFVVGYLQHTLNLSWHIFPILFIYPVWGTVQQFLMIGLVAGNLKDFKNAQIKKGPVVLLSATMFSIVHYPDIWLLIGTFTLGLFYGYVYLKSKNLYVLGIFHGWLGALFYYTVVNRDPFLEVFGKW